MDKTKGKRRNKVTETRLQMPKRNETADDVRYSYEGRMVGWILKVWGPLEDWGLAG
jgi:hypothetical protein